MSPAVAIVLTVGWAAAMALWPLAGWRWQLVNAAVLAGWTVGGRLAVGRLVRRLGLLWVFVGLMGLGQVGHADWPLRVGNLLLKSTLCLWLLSLLMHHYRWAELLEGLRQLRVPRLWTDVIAFAVRYLGVFTDEWRRMQLAQRARTLRWNRRRAFGATANSLGLLFIRAYERAEKVHRAMLARGHREGTT